ncbi:COR domain-containing protein [Streptomyces sp. NBC_01451]|uniref:COR domain-containing protein n=1 Tax=Streptomyces sp. NBC_01451 TaxID=2903872 RepID=UPI002E37B8FE|nr:COR domain-containing protein [Streptomyces sp. NBC_01451]
MDAFEVSGGWRVRLSGPIHEMPNRLKNIAHRISEVELLEYRGDSLPTWLNSLPLLTNLAVSFVGGEPLGELANLPRTLTSVTLRGQRLTDVPSGIMELPHLRRLSLQGVSVKTLPDFLGNLGSLTELIVNAPLLESLPGSLGRLQCLRSLRIASQRLKVLPPRLGRLPDTIDLRLECPALSDSIAKLLGRGVPALLTYLTSLEERVEELYEAKLVVIGEGNVGKSSLVGALRGQEFVADRPTTHGIEVEDLRLPHPDGIVKSARQLHLNVWDFGGQEVYRISHQFFYSQRSLYLLVWRPRDGQEENAVEGWIRRVRLRTGDGARIIVVSTYSESEGRQPELDYPELKRKFGPVLVGQYAVDSLTGAGIGTLKEAIAREAAKLPQMGELLSQYWIQARDVVLERAQRDPWMGWEEFISMCQSIGLEDAATETLAALLHDLGHIIHFDQDQGLRDIIILQPEWLTKAIGYVLEDKITRDEDGVLRYERLGEIWGNSAGREGYPASFHPYFLRLMEKFDVSYRLPGRRAALVGQLVPYSRPSVPWDPRRPVPSGEHSAALLCSFSEPPVGLIAWLTVRNNKYWTSLRWRRGVYLLCEEYGAGALLELINDRELRISVHGPSPYMFLALLRDSTQHLVSERWQGLSPQFAVPCPTRSLQGDSCAGSFPVPILEKLKSKGVASVACHACAETHDIVSLLTGFSPDSTSVVGLRALSQQIKAAEVRTQEGFQMLAGAQLASDLQLKRGLSEIAFQFRAIRHMLANEMHDCPSLFALSRQRSKNPLARRYVLTLFCEETNQTHAWVPATYEIRCSRSVVSEIQPFLALVVPLLSLAVPIVGTLASSSVSENMKAGVETLATGRDFLNAQGSATEIEAAVGRLGGSAHDEARRGYRTFRYLLLQVDPGREFGGLMRRTTAAGDSLWLCPEHLQAYDPGLPAID